jgi:hypothetical protein
MIVLISSARTDVDDPRDLDRIMTKDLAAYATKTGATMSTTITVDGECHGFPGVISTATLSKPDLRTDIPLKVVGCTALQNGRGYFFAYFVPEFLTDVEEPELQRIVNATDVFDVPPPSGFTISATVDINSRSPLDGNSGFLGNRQFGAIPRPAPTTAPITTFSNRGVRTTPTPMPRPVITTPAPTTPIRFGANGSVESSGPQHVNGVNKASDAANDAKMRSYRQRVPW